MHHQWKNKKKHISSPSSNPQQSPKIMENTPKLISAILLNSELGNGDVELPSYPPSPPLPLLLNLICRPQLGPYFVSKNFLDLSTQKSLFCVCANLRYSDRKNHAFVATRTYWFEGIPSDCFEHLSPLAGVSFLKLSINSPKNVNIRDLSPLAGLSNLQKLNLYCC